MFKTPTPLNLAGHIGVTLVAPPNNGIVVSGTTYIIHTATKTQTITAQLADLCTLYRKFYELHTNTRYHAQGQQLDVMMYPLFNYLFAKLFYLLQKNFSKVIFMIIVAMVPPRLQKMRV